MGIGASGAIAAIAGKHKQGATVTPKHIDHYVDHQRIALCGIPGDNINHFSVVTARFAIDQHPELADHFCEACLKAFKTL